MTDIEITRARMAAYKRLLVAERALKQVRARIAAAVDADDLGAFEQALKDDWQAGAEHEAADAACAAT